MIATDPFTTTYVEMEWGPLVFQALLLFVWVCGLSLSVYRRDIAIKRRVVVAISMGINLFICAVWAVLAIVPFTVIGSGSLDATLAAVSIINCALTFLFVLSQGLLLYAIFARFDAHSAPNPMAIESPPDTRNSIAKD